jgi:hypothetical protein
MKIVAKAVTFLVADLIIFILGWFYGWSKDPTTRTVQWMTLLFSGISCVICLIGLVATFCVREGTIRTNVPFEEKYQFPEIWTLGKVLYLIIIVILIILEISSYFSCISFMLCHS